MAYTVDQEVRVFCTRNARSHGQPEGGWVGRVDKVATKYVYIAYPDMQYGEPEAFSKETGRSKDRERILKSLEQVALDQRYATAEKTLRAHGVKLVWDHGLKLEHLEALADVAKTFSEENA